MVSFCIVSCASIPVGGEGSTHKGDTLIAEAMLGYDGNNTVNIMSSKGWECHGSYATSHKTTTRKFPLTCSNGSSGNAIMSVNQVQSKATIAFTLNNGVTGDVAFGMVN